MESAVVARSRVRRFIDADDTSIEPGEVSAGLPESTCAASNLLLIVHSIDRGFRLSFIGKSNKTEAATAVGIPILDNNLSTESAPG